MTAAVVLLSLVLVASGTSRADPPASGLCPADLGPPIVGTLDGCSATLPSAKNAAAGPRRCKLNPARECTSNTSNDCLQGEGDCHRFPFIDVNQNGVFEVGIDQPYGWMLVEPDVCNPNAKGCPNFENPCCDSPKDADPCDNGGVLDWKIFKRCSAAPYARCLDTAQCPTGSTCREIMRYVQVPKGAGVACDFFPNEQSGGVSSKEYRAVQTPFDFVLGFDTAGIMEGNAATVYHFKAGGILRNYSNQGLHTHVNGDSTLIVDAGHIYLGSKRCAANGGGGHTNVSVASAETADSWVLLNAQEGSICAASCLQPGSTCTQTSTNEVRKIQQSGRLMLRAKREIDFNIPNWKLDAGLDGDHGALVVKACQIKDTGPAHQNRPAQVTFCDLSNPPGGPFTGLCDKECSNQTVCDATQPGGADGIFSSSCGLSTGRVCMSDFNDAPERYCYDNLHQQFIPAVCTGSGNCDECGGQPGQFTCAIAPCTTDADCPGDNDACRIAGCEANVADGGEAGDWRTCHNPS
jgi:hypothetical protein